MLKCLSVYIAFFALTAIVFSDAAPGLSQDDPPSVQAIESLYRVADIYSGASSSYPAYLAVYDNALYFSANGNDGAGNELWKYTIAGGAQRVADIWSGATHSDPRFLAVYDGALYFGADGGDGAGKELWKYTTAGGAQRVADIWSGAFGSAPYFLAVYDGALYFSADGGDGAGKELWKYTIAGGAQRVADINSGASGSYPAYLAVYDNALYFSANGEDTTGQELWKYDPVNGPQRVADIYSGVGSSDPGYLESYNGALYFSADGNDGAGCELWKYDPVNGAGRVADIRSGAGSSYPYYLAVYDNALYFRADGGDGAGSELWLYSNTSNAVFRSVAAYDGWVLESGEATNTGGLLDAASTASRLGDSALNHQYRSILSFDTSTLPDAAVVTSITLSIRRQGFTGTNPFTTHGNIKVDIRKGAFGGSTALQASDFQATPGKLNAGTITNTPGADNWYSAKLGIAAHSYVNPKGTTQLRLRFVTDDNNDEAADYLRFYTGNAGGLYSRPCLEVTYYVP